MIIAFNSLFQICTTKGGSLKEIRYFAEHERIEKILQYFESSRQYTWIDGVMSNGSFQWISDDPTYNIKELSVIVPEPVCSFIGFGILSSFSQPCSGSQWEVFSALCKKGKHTIRLISTFLFNFFAACDFNFEHEFCCNCNALCCIFTLVFHSRL